MTRTTRSILAAVCVFTLGVLPHPLNQQAALAFAPTPAEACCMAVVNREDAAICGETLPSAHECRRILENMSAAAARHWESIDAASERAGKTEAQVRNARADDMGGRLSNIPVYAGIAILVLAFAYAFSFLNRTRLRGILTAAIFLLNLMGCIAVVLYVSIVLLCRIGDGCATTNLLLVYVALSIPVGLILLPAIFITYLRSASQAKMSLGMLLFNVLSLATIFIFKIGTSV